MIESKRASLSRPLTVGEMRLMSAEARRAYDQLLREAAALVSALEGIGRVMARLASLGRSPSRGRRKHTRRRKAAVRRSS